jgi:transcription elongation factor Elf1
MLTQISKKELKRQLDNHEICLRCGTEKKLVKKEGSIGCSVYGTHYKKHIYKLYDIK